MIHLTLHSIVLSTVHLLSSVSLWEYLYLPHTFNSFVIFTKLSVNFMNIKYNVVSYMYPFTYSFWTSFCRSCLPYNKHNFLLLSWEYFSIYFISILLIMVSVSFIWKITFIICLEKIFLWDIYRLGVFLFFSLKYHSFLYYTLSDEKPASILNICFMSIILSGSVVVFNILSLFSVPQWDCKHDLV